MGTGEVTCDPSRKGSVTRKSILESPRRALCLMGVLLCLITSPAVPQPCGPGWLPGQGVRGTLGSVSAIIDWDPDGVGPREPVLVLSGSFLVAGDAAATRIAVFDPSTDRFSALGDGFDIGPGSLAAHPDGRVFAAGMFSMSGETPIADVAVWDGRAWSQFGAEIGGGFVRSLAVGPDGSVYVSGDLAVAGLPAAQRVLRWDGAAWQPLGDAANGLIRALAVMPNGDVVAGGEFGRFGIGASTPTVARWTGSTWVAVQPGLSGVANDLRVLDTGELLAAGRFSHQSAFPTHQVARWDGQVWTPVGPGTAGLSEVARVSVVGSGRLFAASSWPHRPAVAEWDGTVWREVADMPGAIVLGMVGGADGRLYLGGQLHTYPFSQGIVRFDGISWSGLGVGFDYLVSSLAMRSDGKVFAGGMFRQAGNDRVRRVAQWDGRTWTDAPGGIDFYKVTSIVATGDERIVVGGGFSGRGVPPYATIAEWENEQWRALNAEEAGEISALALEEDGTLLAAGDIYYSATGVARWREPSWEWVGGWFSGNLYALAVLANGDIVAGGEILSTFPWPGQIARFDGVDWEPLAADINGAVRALVALPAGGFIAAGDFTSIDGVPASRVAHWDGHMWRALGAGLDGPGYSVAILRNGDVLVGGAFEHAGGVYSPGIARWSEGAWSALGSGLEGYSHIGPAQALTILEHSSGEILVGGDFHRAGGQAAPFFARFSPTGVPWIAAQPQPATTTCGGVAEIFVTPATGYDSISFRWQIEDRSEPDGWRDVSDGVLLIEGTPVAHMVGTDTENLWISASVNFGSVNVRAIVSNACGSVPSQAARIEIVECRCPSDWDNSGAIDGDDIAAFFTDWQQGNADIDQSGGTDGDDITYFFERWQAGC